MASLQQQQQQQQQQQNKHDAQPLKIRTVATHATPGYRNFFATAKGHRLQDVDAMGFGQAWGGWLWRTNLYLDCLRELRKLDREHGTTTVVVICDCYDILFNGSEDAMLQGYERFRARTGKPVLFGAEHCCNKRELCVGRVAMDPEAMNLGFVNAGFSMGPAKDMYVVWRAVRDHMPRHPKLHDQGMLGYLMRTHDPVRARVGLDTRRDVVHNSIRFSEFSWTGQVQHPTAPVVHFPGPGTSVFRSHVYNHVLRRSGAGAHATVPMRDDKVAPYVVLGVVMFAVVCLVAAGSLASSSSSSSTFRSTNGSRRAQKKSK